MDGLHRQGLFFNVGLRCARQCQQIIDQLVSDSDSERIA